MGGVEWRSVRLFRVAHGSGLRSIVERGLLCRRRMIEAGLAFTSIANESIESDRAARTVPCGPGGTLHDYVPFHFGPRSPMLCRISYRNLPSYQGGQRPLTYLTTTIGAVVDAGCHFVFCDGHPVQELTDFYDDVGRLDQVDHALMRERYWKNTRADNDRERRRQAELLVRDLLPWSAIDGVGVMDGRVKQRVEALIGTAGPVVAVRPGWYYSEHSS